MFEDLISRIRVSCSYCNGGEVVTSCDWKTRTAIFDFWCDFCHQSRVLQWLWWGGGGWWKSPTFSIFLAQFSSPIKGPVMIAMGRGSVWVVGWRKSQLTKSNRRFDFFGRDFRHPVSPPSQLQDPRICDIASLSNIFENLKFSKMFDEDAISRIRGSCDCDGEGGGGVDDKNCGRKKSEDTKSVGFYLTTTI